MSKYEDQIGKTGQEVAAAALRRVGVERVEKIGTPVRVIPRGTYKGQTQYQVIWGEKVSGDHHGILPGGLAVLAETKTILDRNLQWSDLREHQPDALSQHADLGGLALLVWVHSTGVYVMRWPVPGFGPRRSLTPERARGLDIESLLPANPGELQHDLPVNSSTTPQELIEKEIAWCEAHRGTSDEGPVFENAFISGLSQAVRLLNGLQKTRKP